MTVKEMAAQHGWKLLAGGEGEGNQIDGCYVGDLLSWVMARAQSGTVMGNVNAIAVAALTDASCILLTENAVLDADAAQKAETQGIPVYGCGANSYQAAIQFYQALQ